MKTTLSAVASGVAILSLAACGEAEPEEVGGMAEADDTEIQELDPSEMPAMVRGSESYRCGDGSVVYVTYYTGDTQVGVSAEQDGVPTILANDAMAEETTAEGEEAEAETEEAAPEASDGPARFSGEGQTLVGTGSTITYNGQSCDS